MNVIELKGISKTFGLGNGATQALHSIDLKVPKGEFLVIMGPSGSGKSTLLNIIGLLDSQDTGDYLLDGRDASNISIRKKARIRRNHIGIIFQNFNLIGRLNVLENVSLPLMYKGISTVTRYERASEILKYLGIQEKEYYMPNQLSGGQLQRAAIARAMVNRPSIVLADEPTGNLDSKSSQVIMAALKEIHQAGNTIIMVTHNPDLARYGDRIIKMVDGRIEEEVTGEMMESEIKEQKKQAEEIVEAAKNITIEPNSRQTSAKNKASSQKNIKIKAKKTPTKKGTKKKPAGKKRKAKK